MNTLLLFLFLDCTSPQPTSATGHTAQKRFLLWTLGRHHMRYSMLSLQPLTLELRAETPHAFPSLMHVTHNSFLLCTPENISISQVLREDDSGCSSLAVERSGEAHVAVTEGNGDGYESSTTEPRVAGGKLEGSDNPGSISAPNGRGADVASNCSLGYDRQSILVLDEDPVVLEAASFLYEKCPSASTLLSYQKGALRVIRGSHARLTKDGRLVLVGHGDRGRGRPATLGGYRAEDVARAAAAVETEGGRVRAVSLVGCGLGKDLRFAAHLLRSLRSLRLETELHLHSSLLSVTHSGEVVSRERGRGPPVWRRGDAANGVVAWLDGAGSLLTRPEGSQRGRVVPGYRGPALFAEPSEWPTHPQMFTPAELRAKYTSIDCLEGLTWGMFFEENEKSRASDYGRDPSHSESALVWLAGQKPIDEPPIKHIVTILDLVREIRYVAKENVNVDLYYVLNGCVYKVRRRTLHVSIAGKYLNPNDPGETLRFVSAFEGERENQTLAELRWRLKASDFNEFCRQSFQFHGCVDGVFGEDGCERWGRYFMAAVFSASVRNFRTFSLFLMSVIACEVSRLRRPDDQICAAFVQDDHPMAGAGTWLERDRRGFYGCSLGVADERTQPDKQAWLELVLHKENVLFTRTSAWMTTVYGGPDNSELDIFGKVKVINQYAYASFIEYFRGTNEGRKLSRGCMTYP